MFRLEAVSLSDCLTDNPCPIHLVRLATPDATRDTVDTARSHGVDQFIL